MKKTCCGYKVVSPNHPQGFSNKNLPKKKAMKQLKAISLNYKKNKKGKKKK